jgi:hypothetical protein
MSLWKRTTLSAAVAAGTVVVLLLFTFASVSAAGAGAVTYTQTFKDVTQLIRERMCQVATTRDYVLMPRERDFRSNVLPGSR